MSKDIISKDLYLKFFLKFTLKIWNYTRRLMTFVTYSHGQRGVRVVDYDQL